jgi:Family of unknown function (DUF6084)
VPELSFRVHDVSPLRYAAVPTLGVRLRISNSSATEPIHSVALNCQVRIEPLGRKYTAEEEARLLDLFGERERWARTMKPMLWMQVALNVPGFSGATEAELALPCTLDFDVAATKYFYGLHEGDIQISILFSGTVFYAGADGALQVAQIPWDREARFHLRAAAWQAAVEMHYPNTIWMRLPRETFDRLSQYKMKHSLPMWEQAIAQLLDRVDIDRASVKQTDAPTPEVQP